MRSLSAIAFCAIGLLAPLAKADLTFVGSQAGLNAFNVTLQQVSSTDVNVVATLTQGAVWFADTGGGGHPGFAFNINGDPGITITNISAPWSAGDVHLATVTTNGPSLGTFNYFIGNPGPGTSAANAGPLSFDVNLASGISINDFISNTAGYYFAADIATGPGVTGESGISATPTTTSAVPEPSSVALLLISVAGVGFAGKKRLKAS